MPKKYDLLVLCTGPEPQRGIFEKLVAAQLENVPLNALIVKGVPGKNGQAIYGKGKIKYADMLPSEVINEIVESSGLVISRPGYSTIMDLIQLQAKGVFIPTPGQTEQEYIAGELTQKAIAFCQNQGEFDLENALHESKKYNGFAGIKGDDDLLKQAIDSIK